MRSELTIQQKLQQLCRTVLSEKDCPKEIQLIHAGQVKWIGVDVIFQSYSFTYGDQFLQLEEQIVTGSEQKPSVSNGQLPINDLKPDHSEEGRVVSKPDTLVTRPQRPHY